ncbi:TPA: hypothetical protein U0779_001629 [Streptococcus suis]|uniref:hypothetical protein n=1 Tax=Streptococcus suis TaxID=1307 RepID=UPI001295D829|nr:hypothetical protein [Streptococcus suis]MBS8024361.1 hypothetical protein [Streptococcus suis]HEM3036778.1 hypothetical protein [Streptococcus suis]HEM6302207.1 hypothetical protein [Streptococcus suis]
MDLLFNIFIFLIFVLPYIITLIYFLRAFTFSTVIISSEEFLSKHSANELKQMVELKEKYGIEKSPVDILIVQKAYLLRMKKQTSALYVLLVALITFVISNVDFSKIGNISLFSTVWWGMFAAIAVTIQSIFIIPKIEERIFLIDSIIENLL